MCQRGAVAAALGLAGLLVAIAAACDARVAAAPQRPLAVVPYRPDGKLIMLAVRVNGSPPFWFDLDSGARHAVIDPVVAGRLRLPVTATTRGIGAGRGTFREDHTVAVELSIGGLRVHAPDPWIVDLSKTGTRDPESGLIGMDVFRRYVVRIDPMARTVAFYDPARYRYSGSGTAVALGSRGDKLYVPMTLTLDNRRSVTYQMRVDTGSEDSADANFVRASSTRQLSRVGVGLGTPYRDYSGVYAAVRLGSYTFHHVWGPPDDTPTVGMEILRRFTLTFDAPAGRLYLEPNADFSQPVPSPAA